MKALFVKDLLSKSIKELVALRKKMQKEQFDLSVKNSLRALKQTHLIRIARRNIAKINTAITQKSRNI